MTRRLLTVNSVFAILLAMYLATGAALAGAVTRVNLIALSPDGDRAVLTYNQDWVEVTLRTGAAHRFSPPTGCGWTSMTYAPSGDSLAMAAFCPASQGQCRDVQSLLLSVGADRSRYRLIAEAPARRWSRLYWRDGGADVLALERRLTAPMATNLADLANSSQECRVASPQLVSLGVVTGRRIHMDLAPEGWRYKRIIGASAGALIAEIAMRRNGPPEISAAAQLDAICSATPRDPLCMSSSVAVELLWRDGDWTFAAAPDRARRGRMVASADLSMTGRERCQARWIGKRFRPVCHFDISRAGAPAREIAAPDGMFGDLAVSSDGEWMLAVSAGVGRRLKQFDLFNTQTGAREAFPHLLTLSPPFAAQADR